MQITEGQHKAANSIVELIAAQFGRNREIHPATAITACARLSGSFLLRSFNLTITDVSPGNVVLSQEANVKGPVLINLLAAALENFGANIDSEKMNTATNAASDLPFIETLQRIQDPAHEIMAQNNLTHEQMAYACALATAFIVNECQTDLPIESGFHTAIFGFIEGSKTFPPDLKPPKSLKKSFFKFWK